MKKSYEHPKLIFDDVVVENGIAASPFTGESNSVDDYETWNGWVN